jgi:hypothetical protein
MKLWTKTPWQAQAAFRIESVKLQDFIKIARPPATSKGLVKPRVSNFQGTGDLPHQGCGAFIKSDAAVEYGINFH